MDVVYALAFPENTASAAQTAIPVRTDFVMILPSFRCNAKRPTSKIIAPSAGTTKLVFRGLNSSLMSAASAHADIHINDCAWRGSQFRLADRPELECYAILGPAGRQIEAV
jgi:hypothetical protein